jgi:hypothetical protein
VLIREGSLDILRLGKRNFREAWAEAKDYVWKALIHDQWRYKCNPYINEEARLIIRPSVAR